MNVENIGLVDQASRIPPPKQLSHIGFYRHQGEAIPGYEQIEPRQERVEVVTGGRGWVRIEGREVEVTAGAVLWHHEGDTTISRSDEAAPYQCLNIVFQSSRNRGARRVPHLTWWRDVEVIKAFITEAVRAFADETFDRRALLAYIYGRLLFQARLWQQSSGRSELPEKLRRALELMEETPVALPAIARRVGWSVAHLHAVCREKLGITPHEFAMRHYMRLARERLAGSDLPLKQIASDCGFSGASAFCHAFKHRVGLTPLEFRKLNQRH